MQSKISGVQLLKSIQLIKKTTPDVQCDRVHQRSVTVEQGINVLNFITIFCFVVPLPRSIPASQARS